jgi:hypothetical protein
VPIERFSRVSNFAKPKILLPKTVFAVVDEKTYCVAAQTTRVRKFSIPKSKISERKVEAERNSEERAQTYGKRVEFD